MQKTLQYTAGGAGRRRFLRQITVTGLGLSLFPSLQAADSAMNRLQALGITLPEVPAPAANYVPWVREKEIVYVAGQLPFRDGELLYPGSVPDRVSVEQARAAARQAGINILAALNAAVEGDLSRVQQCLRLDGYVSSAPAFIQQSAVINGASDLMVEILGARGRHTRTAVGAQGLPLDACVEIAGVFAIDR